MQLGFHFDQTRCTGCWTCVVACKDWKDIPAGSANWMRVSQIVRGKYPNLWMGFLATPCYHCLEPACIEACPTDAITKRQEDGIVVVNRDACLGRDKCAVCLEVCPYGSPQFGDKPDARMQKCDFCLDRWKVGKKPVCVMACPTRALAAGPIEEMKSSYGNLQQAAGFLYARELGPSVVLKPKDDPAVPDAG